MLRKREMVEELKEQEKERKRTEIVERLTRLKEDRIRAKSRLRELSTKKAEKVPLYLKKEQEFTIQEQEQEERRKLEELQARKEMYKRISISEIRIHAKLHDKVLDENLNILSKKRKDQIKLNPIENPDKVSTTVSSQYSSKYLKNAIEEEKRKKIEQVMKEQNLKDKRSKVEKFSKIVQEIYWSRERKMAEKKVREDMTIQHKIQKRKKNLIPEEEKPRKFENYISVSHSLNNLY